MATLPFHVGILVANLDEAIERFSLAFGLTFAPIGEMRSELHGAFETACVVRATYSREGPPYIELIEGQGDGLFSLARGEGVHPDVAAVAALALTAPAHEGKSYAMTGTERITPEEQARILGKAIGRDLVFEVAPREQAIAMVEAMAGTREAAEAILRGVGGPDVPWAHPVPTVEELTGRPARTFREWAVDHAYAFR
ncbi:MAG: hypothetical protein ACREQQ_08390 [Candidatus Binatia bacterium]